MEDREILQAILEKVTGLETEMAEMKRTQQQQGQEITKINITLENETNKNIKILLEGQQGINEKFQKLDKVAEDVEEIKVKVTALEEVTCSNTLQIKELRIAK
mgnify:CR=1 FL=1